MVVSNDSTFFVNSDAISTTEHEKSLTKSIVKKGLSRTVEDIEIDSVKIEYIF